MSTWAAVLVGGIVSVASGFGGVILQWKLGGKQLERERKDARTRRVAAVLGRIRPLLAHLQPESIALATSYIVRTYYEEPWTPIRAELSVLIAGEPAGELRGSLLELEDVIERLFRSLAFMVDPGLQQQALAAGRTLGNSYEEATAEYAEANRLLRTIIDGLHGSVEDSPS